MYCFNCGNKLSDDAIFCDSCGTKIRENKEQSSINENTKDSAEENINRLNNKVNIDDVKEKAREKFSNIKKSSVIKTFISFIKKPLSTTENVVESLSLKDILILGTVFIALILISLMIASSHIATSYYGYFTGIFDAIVWRMIGVSIIAFALVIIVNSLITALFLKLGNAEDIMRKSVALVVMCLGVYSIIGILASIIIKVSILFNIILLVLGTLVYTGIYINVLIKNIKGSKDLRFMLSVIAIAVHIIVSILIFAEIFTNSVVGAMYDIFDYYNYL